MVVPLAGKVGECYRASLALKLLFLSQTLKILLLEYFRDVASCQWERVGVVVWAGVGSDCNRWEEVMVW